MKRYSLIVLALGFVIAGCGGGAAPAPLAEAPSAPAPAVPDVPLNALAGVPVAQGDLNVLQKGVMKTFVARADPFDLLPAEQAYEKSQMAANFASQGGFGFLYEPPPPEPDTEEIERQPYRRLAGIMIGDSVTALIDMGNGQLISVHPGQRIQGTEWMVQSIDEEKAILRRVGSRKKPSEVIVRLESPPFGGGGGGQGGGSNPGANPNPGAPAGAGPGGSGKANVGGARGAGGATID